MDVVTLIIERRVGITFCEKCEVGETSWLTRILTGGPLHFPVTGARISEMSCLTTSPLPEPPLSCLVGQSGPPHLLRFFISDRWQT